MIPNNMAQMIDHTLLKPEVTKEQILGLCEEAKEHQFASVCVNPAWIEDAAAYLKGTDVKVCTVIGFPLGASTPDVKAFETKDAIDKGAQEVDMVINIGALKSGDLALVENDIRAVTAAAEGKALVKVIIETCLLSDEEKKVACKIAKKAGADFVKTSTGFSNGGATERDVKLMHEAVGSQMGVKASGGVRSHEDAVKMINAGATRIGTSSGPKIVNMQ